MNKIQLGTSNVMASQLALGMMRSSLKEASDMRLLLEKALELDMNFIDHADIYAWKNVAEELYGQVMAEAPHLRDKFLVQTKCGICSGYYDSSYQHIIESVNTSLERMHLETIDLLLLHRPDALLEPEEIAKAFDELERDGKVKYFGVCNMNPGQIKLIQKYISQPLIVNQMQMSIVHAPMIDSEIYVNMTDDHAVMRDGSLLDYTRTQGITVQAWSILQAGWKQGTFLENEAYPQLNQVLARLAEKYNVTKSAVALAWLLRHPARIQPISGTASPSHLEELTHAFDFTLTRPEWYELYLSAGRELP